MTKYVLVIGLLVACNDGGMGLGSGGPGVDGGSQEDGGTALWGPHAGRGGSAGAGGSMFEEDGGVDVLEDGGLGDAGSLEDAGMDVGLQDAGSDAAMPECVPNPNPNFSPPMDSSCPRYANPPGSPQTSAGCCRDDGQCGIPIWHEDLRDYVCE